MDMRKFITIAGDTYEPSTENKGPRPKQDLVNNFGNNPVREDEMTVSKDEVINFYWDKREHFTSDDSVEITAKHFNISSDEVKNLIAPKNPLEEYFNQVKESKGK